MRGWMVGWLAGLLLGCNLSYGGVKVHGYTVLKNAKLDTSGYFDGDSYTIRGDDGKQYVFRLYMVDCPESDTSLKSRIDEQAAFWRTHPSDIIKYGKKSTQAVEKLLRGKSLTVYTRWADARGGGRHRRYFAYIEVDGEFVSEILVRDGWARSYGQIAHRPDGKSSDSVRNLYDRLSNQARASRKGAWAGKTKAAEKEDPVARALRGDTQVASRMIPVYSSKEPSRHVTFIRSGQKVTVLNEADTEGYMRVRWKSHEDNKVYEALAKKSDLGIR